MPKTFNISWDEVGERLYETGIDRGVLYVRRDSIIDPTDPYMAGVPWNGLTAINESPSGGEPTPLWADNFKYLELISAEEFGASIEAYTYPQEFYACDGTKSIAKGAFISQQPRKQFGLSYRSIVGNDTMFNDYGYKIHLVYGCFATPSEKGHATINDSPEATTFNWTVSTTPVNVNGFNATSHLVIDSTMVDADKLAAIEDIIYGKAATTDPQENAVPARLPMPEEIISIITSN